MSKFGGKLQFYLYFFGYFENPLVRFLPFPRSFHVIQLLYVWDVHGVRFVRFKFVLLPSLKLVGVRHSKMNLWWTKNERRSSAGYLRFLPFVRFPRFVHDFHVFSTFSTFLYVFHLFQVSYELGMNISTFSPCAFSKSTWQALVFNHFQFRHVFSISFFVFFPSKF